MPQLKIFEIFENLLGFFGHKQKSSDKSNHLKRKQSERPENCNNGTNNNSSHSSVALSESSIVS